MPPTPSAQSGGAETVLARVRDPSPETAERRLLAAIADYLFECDAAWRLRAFTPLGRDPLGYDAATLLGRPLSDLAAEPERARLARGLARRASGRRTVRRLRIGVGPPSRGRALEIDAAPLFDASGGLTGYRGVARVVRAERPSTRLGPSISQAVIGLVNAPNVDAAMPEALKTLGEALKVDRILVFENRAEQPGPVALLHGWEAPGAPRQSGPLQGPFAEEADGWADAMREGRTYAGYADTAKGLVAQLIQFSGAKTVLFAPILVAGSWWGTLLVDDCQAPRRWSEAEKEAVKMLAEIVGAAVLRERHQQERARAEQALNLATQQDNLTGLASRKLFSEQLDRAILAAATGGPKFAVLYVDLDHFKDVNDTMGHPAGDRLLQAVAERLRAVTHAEDTVARFGGDEFAILRFDVRRPEDAAELARRIIDMFKEPFEIDRREVHVGASLGISLPEAGAVTAEVMLSRAELALYRAKAEGRRTYRFFTSSMDAEARRRVILSEDLRRGIANGEFFLVYQPQVEIAGGKLVGLEALVRWRHPTRGLVSPTDFIPAAESNGLIIQLGEWVLRAACWQARDWIDRGIAPPSLSVNTSAVQFRRPEVLEAFIGEVLRDTRLPRGMLQLELTETALMEASISQADVLDRLHRQGVKISLDDFGTGYSSLDYLHRYRVDEIKIAQEFVSRMVDDRGDGAIVRAAINLAQALELRVLAEGVERPEQAQLLSDWGCTDVQGFYFARPLAPADVEPILKAGLVRPAAAATASSTSPT